MFYVLSWFFVIALLALWSLATWSLHAVAVWAVSNVGVLTGAASGAGSVAVPDWMAPWLSPELAQQASQMVASVAPFVDGMLQTAPSLADGLTVVTWVIWGIGGVLLVLLGAGLHLLIAMWRGRGGGRPRLRTSSSLTAG